MLGRQPLKIFLRARTPARVCVINGLSRDVATFFRIVQRHSQSFLEMLKSQLSSRAEFTRLLVVDPYADRSRAGWLSTVRKDKGRRSSMNDGQSVTLEDSSGVGNANRGFAACPQAETDHAKACEHHRPRRGFGHQSVDQWRGIG